MFRNVTIRSRVIGIFAILIVATLAMAGFSIQRLTAVNGAADDVGSNWLPASNALGDLSEGFEQVRARQAQAVLSTGDIRASYMEELRQDRAQLMAAFSAYEETVTSDEERPLTQAVSDALTTYMSFEDDYEHRVDADDTAGATAMYFGDMRPAAEKLRQTIHDARAYQLKKGQEAAASGMAMGKQAITLLYIAAGITILVALASGIVMVRTISMPITRMSGAMRTLANGNTDVAIPNVGEKNEIGDMASAVGVFRDNMIRNQALEAETAQARRDAETQRRETMNALADQFESAVGGVVDMVSSAATEMQATAQQLTGSAQESAAQATTVSAAAEEAGANVTSVAGAAEELGASVSEISRQVEHSLNRAREAVSEADSTTQVVQELSEAAGRITGIVDMISGIASQTNLLALNATIESARAGEAGKGFAVVASEVKALAQQTTKATDEINTQIAAIQTTTSRAVEAIENISRTIRDINDSSSTIAAAVEQQGGATSEIVEAVNQASLGTQEVTSNITGVARMAEETGAGANQVLSASSELAQQAEVLRSKVQDFISQIRAA